MKQSYTVDPRVSPLTYEMKLRAGLPTLGHICRIDMYSVVAAVTFYGRHGNNTNCSPLCRLIYQREFMPSCQLLLVHSSLHQCCIA